LAFAREELEKREDEIRKLIDEGQHRQAISLMTNLKANQLVRPTAVEKTADYITVTATTDGEERIIPNGRHIMASQWDKQKFVEIFTDSDGINYDTNGNPEAQRPTDLSVRL
jgi:hypothetical protein